MCKVKTVQTTEFDCLHHGFSRQFPIEVWYKRKPFQFVLLIFSFLGTQNPPIEFSIEKTYCLRSFFSRNNMVKIFAAEPWRTKTAENGMNKKPTRFSKSKCSSCQKKLHQEFHCRLLTRGELVPEKNDSVLLVDILIVQSPLFYFYFDKPCVFRFKFLKNNWLGFFRQSLNPQLSTCRKIWKKHRFLWKYTSLGASLELSTSSFLLLDTFAEIIRFFSVRILILGKYLRRFHNSVNERHTKMLNYSKLLASFSGKNLKQHLPWRLIFRKNFDFPACETSYIA